jgi:hypothetical protein
LEIVSALHLIIGDKMLIEKDIIVLI